MRDLYIKGGVLVDPEKDLMYAGNLLVREGRISKICSTREEEPLGVPVLRADGLMIAPGLADTHVHFRDPGFLYKEDIDTGAAAAKKGGFTQIVLMANTNPCVDNREVLSYVLKKGEKTGIHIHSCANVSRQMKGKELADLEDLASAGAAGFTDDGVPLLDRKLVRKAMVRARELKKIVSFHEEDPKLITNNGIHAGEASRYYGIGGSPREAEYTMVERDIGLAEETGAEIVIQHISTKEAVELVRQARKRGTLVHAEATPHHFTLTQQAAIDKGALAKMNPPLREEEDRLAIIRGLADGTIELIATDHAPHSRAEKEQAITVAPSGIIGLETALSLGIRELVEKGYLTLPSLIHRMSTAPCRLYGLEGGVLKEGAAADFVLFDPKEHWTVKEFASKSSNSPFLGEEMHGVVHVTICGGEIVYEREK